MHFGEILKKIRKENNKTQQELADFLGVNRSSIAGYETKKKHPDFNKLKLIAEYFNVSTDTLLDVNLSKSNSNDYEINYGNNLPHEAINEIENYINYIKYKYENKDII